jgi:hypothetical protein
LRAQYLDDVERLWFGDPDDGGRRRRHPVNYDAELRPDRGSKRRAYTAKTLNVSEGGCAIRVDGRIVPDTVATLCIEYGATPIELPVRVVWTDTDAHGRVAGLAFNEPTPIQQLAIESFITAETAASSASPS